MTTEPEPLKLRAKRLAEMSDVDIGRTASGGYGAHKQNEFLADLKAVAESVARGGLLRLALD